VAARLPATGREPSEKPRAERRRLGDGRDLDGDARGVRLELHEETVRCPSAVDAKHVDLLTRAAHRFDEIARLVRDALERRTSEMCASGPALDPDQQTA